MLPYSRSLQPDMEGKSTHQPGSMRSSWDKSMPTLTWTPTSVTSIPWKGTVSHLHWRIHHFLVVNPHLLCLQDTQIQSVMENMLSTMKFSLVGWILRFLHWAFLKIGTIEGVSLYYSLETLTGTITLLVMSSRYSWPAEETHQQIRFFWTVPSSCKGTSGCLLQTLGGARVSIFYLIEVNFRDLCKILRIFLQEIMTFHGRGTKLNSFKKVLVSYSK